MYIHGVCNDDRVSYSDPDIDHAHTEMAIKSIIPLGLSSYLIGWLHHIWDQIMAVASFTEYICLHKFSLKHLDEFSDNIQFQ